MRGRGLGTIALRESIAALKVAGIILITLEVDHSNLAAQSLYRDMGFELREKYGYMFLKL
jgi:ribosomal protein S18 acetylase RimI-like enzyme